MTGHESVTRDYPFELDRFQLDSIAAIDAGEHVVVAAPTGSGKTVVAEHGIDTIRDRGRRAFYTTPIKALSNQKYRDLLDRYGPGQVGLLTGDNSIDADAPVVVMTTEVVRNMIYARSDALEQVDLVVVDEVHFLQDAYRGPVWEEVIIHLPGRVQLVCLSATVSNAAELAGWIETVRGPARAVVETARPVRLDDYYLLGERDDRRLRLLPTFVDGSANASAARLDRSAVRRGGNERGSRRSGERHRARRVLYTPTRTETLGLLEQRSMLPAIVFIFSRNQCDEAAGAVVDAGMSLTGDDERAEIRRILDARLEGVGSDDLAALGYERLRAQLEAGVAPHHAGMVPPFKEAVEQCFAAGLLRAVFATETLAVGVNMPARSVVIEKLTKFTGDHHEMLTPGEYTQLTGRAGRRGIDDVGHAVVLWSPFVAFERVAELAASRTFHLRSAFRPTYNMAANLIANHTPEDARHLLNLSFAQYQSDRDVVRLEARAERLAARLAEARGAAESSYGDIWEYRRLRSGDADGPAGSSRDDAAAALQPGDIVQVKRGRFRGRVAMVASARRKVGMRLTVVTPGSDILFVTTDDIVGPVVSLGRIPVPATFQPKSPKYRRAVARALRAAKTDAPPKRRQAASSELHPVEFDPELRERVGAAGRAARIQRDLAEVTGRIERHHRTVGREFDRVIDVLTGRGHVLISEDGARWALTDTGRMLSRVFHECDLVVVECLQHGHFDGLEPPVLAGVLSTLVYEHRSPEPPGLPWFPDAGARRRYKLVAATSEDVAADERSRGLGEHRPPDPGFFAAAHGWVAGLSLDDILDDEASPGGSAGAALTGGDFVRTMKQVIDLARQIGDVAREPATGAAAVEAARLAHRGVVADVGDLAGVR